MHCFYEHLLFSVCANFFNLITIIELLEDHVINTLSISTLPTVRTTLLYIPATLFKIAMCHNVHETNNIALFSIFRRGGKFVDELLMPLAETIKEFDSFIPRGVDLADHTSIFLLRTINHYVTFIICTLS